MPESREGEFQISDVNSSNESIFSPSLLLQQQKQVKSIMLVSSLAQGMEEDEVECDLALFIRQLSLLGEMSSEAERRKRR